MINYNCEVSLAIILVANFFQEHWKSLEYVGTKGIISSSWISITSRSDWSVTEKGHFKVDIKSFFPHHFLSISGFWQVFILLLSYWLKLVLEICNYHMPYFSTSTGVLKPHSLHCASIDNMHRGYWHPRCYSNVLCKASSQAISK